MQNKPDADAAEGHALDPSISSDDHSNNMSEWDRETTDTPPFLLSPSPRESTHILGLDEATIRQVREEFDSAFYLDNNPDVKAGGSDPLEHYLVFGSKELRDPSPYFSTAYYLSEHRSSIPQNEIPFVHYVTQGKSRGLYGNPELADRNDIAIIRPHFDAAFYIGQNPDVAGSHSDPLSHYLQFGDREERDPSATFPVRWYRETIMRGCPPNTNSLVHFIKLGVDQLYERAPALSTEELAAVSESFDAEFYITTYLGSETRYSSPLQHYLSVGWLLGFDPSPYFSTKFYLKSYRTQVPPGVNPLVHYVTRGRKIGFSGSHRLSALESSERVKNEFDYDFYLSGNPDIRAVGLDPFEHYMIVGWRQGRDPNNRFSTVFYSRAYPDVPESGLHPLVHYVEFGKDRYTSSQRPYLPIAPGLDRYSESEILARCQDLLFPLALETTKRLLVIIVPEHNEMSGGIFSMLSIAKILGQTKRQHGYDVILMTRPNLAKYTYTRQRNFRNSGDIYRLEQLLYCPAVEELYLHIPEYAANNFLATCSEELLRYLLSRKRLDINILNQNIELMPEPEAFVDLRRAADSLTQSVAHHAYFTQACANQYRLPTLLLPAYTDLREYTPIAGAEKEDIILYSYDFAWYKDRCLDLLRKAFPAYQMIEVRDITFEHFMDLATRCRFSISFGEGFDGYVAQPIYQGGIGFTVYRKEFFPSEKFLEFPNFFRDPEHLLRDICSLMRKLEQDIGRYDALNRALLEEYNSLYRLDEYHSKIGKLARRQFEIFPEIGGDGPDAQ